MKTILVSLFLCLVFVPAFAQSSDPATAATAEMAAKGVEVLQKQILAFQTQIAALEKRCASATGGSVKSKLEKQLAELKKELEELKKKAATGCAGYADAATQAACLNILKAITVDGEKNTLETFERVGRPVPLERVEQEVEDESTPAASSAASSAPAGGGKKTITEKYGPNTVVPYKKVVRCTGGEIPACTTIVVGERAPIPPILFPMEDEDVGASSWLYWVGGGALAGAAVGAGIGMAAVPTEHASSEAGFKWDDGGGSMGALIGLGAGMVAGVIGKAMFGK